MLHYSFRHIYQGMLKVDKKKRVELIITAVLVAVFLLAWANSRKFLKSKTAAKNNVSPAQEPARRSGGEGAAAAIAPVESDESLPWKRCPFSGKVYSGSQAPVRADSAGFTLSGIVWDSEKPRAIINDKIVSIGAGIGGYTVIEIKTDRVILSDGSRDLEIKVGQ